MRRRTRSSTSKEKKKKNPTEYIYLEKAKKALGQMKKTLSVEQNQIVFSGIKNRHHCVKALSGTGKTYTIICRFLYLLEKKIRPKNILLLSFSRKAQKELQERIFHTLEVEETEKENFSIFTFHKFAREIMKKGKKQHRVLDASQQIKAIQRVLKDKSEFKISRNDSCRFIGNLLYKKEILEESLDDDKKAIIEEYKKAIAPYQAMDYTQLLITFYKLAFVQQDENIQKFLKDVSHLIIDEFQDCNDIQLKIAKAINCNTMVVGDVNQHIFSFGIGECDVFSKFCSWEGKLFQYQLTVNFRCAIGIQKGYLELMNIDNAIVLDETDRRIAFIDVANIEEQNLAKIKIINFIKSNFNGERILMMYRTNKERIEFEKLLSSKYEDLTFVSTAKNEEYDSSSLLISTTIHKIKGGEAEHAIISNFYEQNIPKYRKTIVGDYFDDNSYVKNDIPKEKRIFYVGMSRAKKWLFLIKPRFIGLSQQSFLTSMERPVFSQFFSAFKKYCVEVHFGQLDVFFDKIMKPTYRKRRRNDDESDDDESSHESKRTKICHICFECKAEKMKSEEVRKCMYRLDNGFCGRIFCLGGICGYSNEINNTEGVCLCKEHQDPLYM